MKKKLIQVSLGLFLLACFSTSGFAQWEKTNWPATSSYFDLYINENNVLARTWDTLNGGSTFLSADDGVNWTQISVADSSKEILSLVILNDTILAGTWDGLISTTVGSTDWAVLTPTGIPADNAICSLAMINTSLYAGAMGTIYKSSDSGDTWTEINSGIPASARINSFARIGDAVFAGSDTSGVYISTDAGSNWTAINTGLTDLHISQLVTMGDILYAVTLKGGAFTSSDNGTNWTAIDLPNVNCMVVADSKLYAGTDYEGLYQSTDNGASWAMVVTGMPDNTRFFSMVTSDENLIAGTSDGVWSASLSSIITPVENSDTPEAYVLERNYPNPFNPTTTIGFSIPVSEHVTLTIYNITGQKIRTLIDTQMLSGVHKVVWDGLTDAGMRPPSGVYLYELRAGTFRDAKKLLMMK